jgi:hypothetical protein
MDSVSDLVGVTVVVTMVAWGWSVTRDARAILFPAPAPAPVAHPEHDEVIVLP